MDFSSQIPKFTINCEPELVRQNVAINIRRHLPQLQTYEKQDQVLGLVGGGPSLDISDIQDAQERELKFVSMNGTHDWLLDHGIQPSMHVQVDAREHNARFVQNPQHGTRYLIASQSHPAVFENLEGYDVTIWHGISTPEEKPILDDYYFGQYLHVIGGSTVMLRAFTLLSMLGFKDFEVFGFDSCYIGDDHHAYEQPENGKDNLIHLKVGDREFVCGDWMYSQAKDFIGQTKALGNNWNLSIHGDGLIAHILKTGAEKANLQETH